MTMQSNSLVQRLATLSPADKQRLLAHLLREKAKNHAEQLESADPLGWVHDAQLDPNIQPLLPASHCNDPRTVLLTGATGFLGAHLLHELCDRTDATIYCLVRAQNGQEAQERLQTNFARYFIDGLDTDRVRPLVGDLAQRNLGLTRETYNALAHETDIIVHNGAHLHHMAPYAHLKASNVDSTVAMLQLATAAKPKWVHYVSTLVAAVDRDSDGWLLESLPQAEPAELAGGYAQSKWVSEKLLAEAVRRGIGVTIFRPAFISGRSDNGIWPLENDHLLRVIKGCVQMGHATESDLIPNMSPVDFVSAAIVRIALSPHCPGRVFNLSNPHHVSWETLLAWLQGFGYRVRVVSNDVWREQHLQYLEPENALFPVLPLYLGGEITDRHVGLLSKLARVRNDGTAQMLARLDTSFPVIDQVLWRRYVRYFQESGFLPVPD
jgi:thioester reductase-like protein